MQKSSQKWDMHRTEEKKKFNMGKEKMKEITYLQGDALEPNDVNGRKIIFHICNNIGGMGAGIARQIRFKWPIVYLKYLKLYEEKTLVLGDVQFVKVEKNLVVANMIAQESIGMKNGIPPIRYKSLEKCLKILYNVSKKHNASVVGPRIGCGFAGGKWEKIEPIIKENLCEKDIPVYIYDLWDN